VEGGAEEDDDDVAGDWTILLARRTRTIRMCSFDARSEGQSSHPLVLEHFTHGLEKGE
jgi:hypothetical protein